MDLYLIAHKVRGEPAFDIAVQMECPECPEGTDEGFCNECDNTGWWWIIPTSGHRAYPYWNTPLAGIEFEGNGNYSLSEELTNMPEGIPDHYQHTASRPVSLITALGLDKPKAPLPPIIRRI